MKVGDLVRIKSSFWQTLSYRPRQFVNFRGVGFVLETRSSPPPLGRGHFREERTEIRAFFAEDPEMSEHFCNAKFFEVISEAK